MSEEVFEIADYTCASPFEKLVKDVESMLLDWNVHAIEVVENEHCLPRSQKIKEFNHGGRDYEMVYYCPGPSQTETNASQRNPLIVPLFPDHPIEGELEPLVSMTTQKKGTFHPDHTITGNHLLKWFGFSRCIKVGPAIARKVSRDEACTLLSVLSLAASHCKCDIPLFVVVHESWECLYYGNKIGGGKNSSGRFRFDVQAAPEPPVAAKHLAALLDLFNFYHPQKSRLSSNQEKVIVAASYSYQWKPKFSDVNDDESAWRDRSTDKFVSLGALWGPISNPVHLLKLQTHWPYFPQHTFVENEVTSLDPAQAPNWSVSVEWSVHTPADSPLANLVRALLNMSLDLDPSSSTSTSTSTSASDGHQRQTVVSLGTSTSSSLMLGSVSGEVIDNMIARVLASDDDTNDNDDGEGDGDGDGDGEEKGKKEEEGKKLADIQNIMAVPFQSVLSRLMFEISELYRSNVVSSRVICTIWLKFTAALRKLWEQGRSHIPILSPSNPQHHWCLIHQKLQLLQWCIDAKAQQQQQSKQRKSTSKKSSKSTEGEGIASAHENLQLLGTNKALNIPKCQEEVRLTLDAAEEEQELFAKLGTSVEASARRAELQSRQLFSDMQAFKAANPGCFLEDFVRWHSPKDWTFDPERKYGRLSPRFEDSDNLWSQLWKHATALPAHRQIRLLDHQAEAEKVLDYLTIIEPRELMLQLARVAIGNCVGAYSRTEGSTMGLPALKKLLNAISGLPTILALSTGRQLLDRPSCQNLHKQLSSLELMCARAECLLNTAELHQSREMINSLLIRSAGKALTLKDRDSFLSIFRDTDSVGRSVGTMSVDAPIVHRLPETPWLREYTILQPRTGNRMYVRMENGENPEFRMARTIATTNTWRTCGVFAKPL